jgi:hypothetical protein
VSLRRSGWGLVAVVCVGMAWAQTSAAQANPKDESKPVPATTPGVTPPVVESGQKTIEEHALLTQKQEDELQGDEQNILKFVSKDTQLEIKHPVKSLFLSREQVNKELREKFDEDKGNKRMQRSELVLKKFGLLDEDFHLRPFLLSLLTEQIAGFYDNKKKTMNLLNWVDIDEQKPVMAHELTHALQDQYVDLEKWEDPEPDSVAKNVGEDNLHIRTDEAGTVREAVLEGQAMVSFADKMLADNGFGNKTLKDVPQIADKLTQGAGDMGESPVLARAPLVLQQALLFPYTSGLTFEAAVLTAGGVPKAFKGMLDSPPNSSMEILHPQAYLNHVVAPVMLLPDIHPTLKSAGYEPYDVGVMGELDVRMTAELFGGKPLADALAPAWDGGIYYAAQRSAASDADKETTASLALLYLSRWKNEDSARSFMRVFEEELPRQYNGLKRRNADEQSSDERVFTTREGDVLLVQHGNTVWVSEGFDLALARKLEAQIESTQGSGPMRVAEGRGTRVQGPGFSKELTGGLVGMFAEMGVMKVGLK